MSEAEANLLAAIEQSYSAFACMSRPQKLLTSPLRDGDEILQTLTSAPLRELTGEQIGPYSSYAITTVGDDRDYRHFLPRIFELAVMDPTWLGAYPAVMAGKLKMANWRTWPAEQQAAVLRFFRAGFEAAVERHPNDDHTAKDWFCGIAIIGEPVSPPIEHWRSSSSPNAALHMASFIIDEAKHLSRHGEVRGGFWEEVSQDVRAEVARLLTARRTREFLQAVASRVADEEQMYFLNPALGVLQQVGCIEA